jgi:endonuclease/exonuclease/phosphatase family metal-dependent hydrolase
MKLNKVSLKIITLNCWHALDPTKPYLMFPVQSPIEILKRYKRQIQSLKETLDDSFDFNILCLQELNPLFWRIKKIKKKLNLEGIGAYANTGIRAGLIGYPLFLDEGLATFWTKNLNLVQSDSKVISGAALDFDRLLGVPLFFQIAEKRVALSTRFEFQGIKFLVINLHAHNGAETRESLDRRSLEFQRVAEWIKPFLNSIDIAFICGDFNCRANALELKPIKNLGFQGSQDEILTWNPKENILCEPSVLKAKNEIEKKWEEEPKQLDHIFYYVSKKIQKNYELKILYKRLFDKKPISDHFGLMGDFVLIKKDKND